MTADWGLLHTFLRAAERGSLSEAARDLGLSQPTVTRHIRSLEQQLGVTLFVRHSRGVSLSDRGLELLAAAQEVDARVQDVIRRAAGLREVAEGDVRISVNEPIGVFVLPSILAQLRAQHPGIVAEVVVDNRASDLSRREADIALRMFEPRQGDLVAKRVGEVEVGLFASRSYAARYGLALDTGSHTLIGADRDPTFYAAARTYGLGRADFGVRTDSLPLQVQAVVAGLGIGPVHVRIARDLGLVRLPSVTFAPLPLWLVTHSELRRSAAVRVVFAELHTRLSAYYGG